MVSCAVRSWSRRNGADKKKPSKITLNRFVLCRDVVGPVLVITIRTGMTASPS